MDQIAHKNNYFKFDSIIKQQVSGAAIRSKFAPPYASIFMDRVKTVSRKGTLKTVCLVEKY